MELNQDFREFIALLNAHEIEYLIVGGYAVALHGHPRYTGDLDVWIKPTDDNAERMLKVLSEFGFSSVDITKDDFIDPSDIIQLGYEPVRIDILTSIDGVVFDECYAERETIMFEGLAIHYISLPNLIRNKKASGRKIDNDDADRLKNQFES